MPEAQVDDFCDMAIRYCEFMLAEENGNEGNYATGIAVVSFVACVLTIPLVAFVMF